VGRDPPPDVDVRAVRKTFGGPTVLRDVSLRVAPGTVLALLGPSGCGKTTLLRTIAGLEAPDAGEVRVGGRVLSSPGAVVAPERRRIGMVFQDWALFPHLSVTANVAYGLPRSDRGGRSPRVAEALEMVGLSGLGDRSPGTLSGGQQQRVALARALAPRPSVLLLDEPFSNLDSTLRAAVRTDVHCLLDELEVTTVFVTHDQEEAFVLGDEVAVMADGEVVQQATPAALYDAPASPWVAAFVGEANLVPGEARGRSVATPVGDVPLRAPATGAVEVLVRPELLDVGPGDGGVVEAVEYYGHDTVYVLALAGMTLRARATGPPRLRRGDEVSVAYRGDPAPAWPS
jgi:iron(III) transport system ATP-binding protein